MVKNKSTIVLLSILFSILLIHLSYVANAQSNSKVITGQVLDDSTNQAIINATVSVWNTFDKSPLQWRLVETKKTNYEGKFSLEIISDIPYRVYIYCDDPSSPGFDYIPAFKDLSLLEENIPLHIRLLPAASIIFEGDLWFVESTKPSESFSFIIPELENLSSGDNGYVNSYGTVPPNHNFLNTSSKHVVFPVERGGQIEVNASIFVSKRRINKFFVIDNIKRLNLTKGDLKRVNIERYTSLINFEFMEEQSNSTTQLLEEISGRGFHTVVEKQDLVYILDLLDLASTEISNNQYHEAYIDLREAYLKDDFLNQRLESIYSNAARSVSTLIFFLAITSIALSFLLFERLYIKMVTYPVFFTTFFLIFYYNYPGCLLITIHSLLSYISLSLGGVFLLTFILPFLVKEKIISTFSLSKRNLRRRRTRFILTIVTVIITVISFVSLTSFSTGYGLTTKKYSYPLYHIPEGILIQQPPPPDSQSTFHFVPIEPFSIELLKEKPEVLKVAPKAENQPQLTPLGFLYLSSAPQRIPFYGYLGIQPNVEAEITNIDSIIVKGRYLRDDDENSILISEELAREMGVEVNGKVELVYGSFRQVTVVGFFDENLFSSITDINGKKFAPSKLIQPDVERPPIKTNCKPREVVITTLKDAMKTYGVYLSRVDLLIENPQESSSFARELALEQGLSVWYIKGNEVYEAVVGSFFEERGSFIFIPWLIVILNVVITMLNSIFEYRKEIAILSSVGLNPSDIMRLFIAEAAIIGVLGGGVGYLLGISNYKLMSTLSIIVEVRPKVSATWSFASVLISLSAVLVGALVALRSSVVITPSMRRRWSIFEKGYPSIGKPWIFNIPLKPRGKELDSFFDYLTISFRRYLRKRGIDERVGNISYSEDEELGTSIKRLNFNYILGQRSKIGSLPFQLVAKKGESEETYSIEVFCKGGEENVKETVSFIRMSIIEWSTNRDRS